MIRTRSKQVSRKELRGHKIPVEAEEASIQEGIESVEEHAPSITDTSHQVSRKELRVKHRKKFTLF